MKTRIVHTRIHFEDDWFNNLPSQYKYPFIYLFTNSHIGMTGTYYLSRRVALTETGCTTQVWDESLDLFRENKRAAVFKNWICVVNAQKYANYSGSKNAVAFNKEIDSIPLEVREYFQDTLSIQYTYSMDTPINKKPEIRKQEWEQQASKETIELAEEIPF